LFLTLKLGVDESAADFKSHAVIDGEKLYTNLWCSQGWFRHPQATGSERPSIRLVALIPWTWMHRETALSLIFRDTGEYQ